MKKILFFLFTITTIFAFEDINEINEKILTNPYGFKQIKVKEYNNLFETTEATKEIIHTFNNRNKLLSSIVLNEYDISITNYEYDNSGSLTEISKNGEKTKFYYDDNGKKVKEIIDGNEVFYKYNNNNLIAKENNKDFIGYKYDKDNRIIEYISKINNSERREVTKYSENKIIKQIFLADKKIEENVSEFDKKGNLKKLTKIYSDSNFETTEYSTTYDSNKNRIEKTEVKNYIDSQYTSNGSWQYINTYDKNNLLVREQIIGNRNTDIYYVYGENNRLEKVLYKSYNKDVLIFYSYKNGLLLEISEYNQYPEKDLKSISLKDVSNLSRKVTYKYVTWYKDYFEKDGKNFIQIIKVKDKDIILKLEKAGIKDIINQKPYFMSNADYIYVLETYANLLKDTDRYLESIFILEKMIEFDSKNPNLYLILGESYVKEYKKNGEKLEKDKAVLNYKKYKTLAGKNAKLTKNIEELLLENDF